MSRKNLTQFSILVIFLLALLVVPLSVQAGGVCGGTYVVEKGETIESIAATCGTSVTAIRAANPGLGVNVTVGQSLIIPGINYNFTPTTPAPTTPVPPTTPAPTTPVPAVNYNNYYNNNNYYTYNYYGYGNTPANYSGVYYVQYGDTFSSIAASFGVTVYDLWMANPNIWDINILYVGQMIHVPASTGNWDVVTPIVTDAAPESLSYGNVPPRSPMGKIKIVVHTNDEIYISFQGTSVDGYDVIREFSVKDSMGVKIPSGYYTYTALVGGNAYYGSFNLPQSGNRTVTITKDSVTDGE